MAEIVYDDMTAFLVPGIVATLTRGRLAEHEGAPDSGVAMVLQPGDEGAPAFGGGMQYEAPTLMFQAREARGSDDAAVAVLEAIRAKLYTISATLINGTVWHFVRCTAPGLLEEDSSQRPVYYFTADCQKDGG